MGTKNNPGKFDCISRAAPDEPIFTLLGRDPVAAAVIRFWVFLRSRVCGHEADLFNEAWDCAEACEAYASDLGKSARVNMASVEMFATLKEFSARGAVPLADEQKHVDAFRPGLHKHYKGAHYRALFLARDHETQAPLVVYVPLTPHGGERLPSPPQVRALCSGKDAWNDEVPVVDRVVRRFTWIAP